MSMGYEISHNFRGEGSIFLNILLYIKAALHGCKNHFTVMQNISTYD